MLAVGFPIAQDNRRPRGALSGAEPHALPVGHPAQHFGSAEDAVTEAGKHIAIDVVQQSAFGGRGVARMLTAKAFVAAFSARSQPRGVVVHPLSLSRICSR